MRLARYSLEYPLSGISPLPVIDRPPHRVAQDLIRFLTQTRDSLQDRLGILVGYGLIGPKPPNGDSFGSREGYERPAYLTAARRLLKAKYIVIPAFVVHLTP